MALFDLNIEQILESWEISHALREVIANALDEQVISQTKDVEISKIDGEWRIRDYGRGLKYTDLTQNENLEKLSNQDVIGKFGVGLKDALATFDRKGISVLIKSRFGDITTVKASKQGFPNIQTLHANISDASDSQMTGTEFLFGEVTDDQIEAAKNLFLKFADEQIMEETRTGQVIKNTSGTGKIYINGVLVAEEPTFLFSYNITKKTKKIQNALNRERTNVGRSAYSDSIKNILLETKSIDVSGSLAIDFQGASSGTAHYEMLNWKDAQIHAIKILNPTGKFVFVTQDQVLDSPDLMDEARSSGMTLIPVTDSIGASIENLKDHSGNSIKGMTQFVSDYRDSFEFSFVELNDLSQDEKKRLQLYSGNS